CREGEHAYGPRNVFHTYRNVGDTDLKMLIVYTPAGFEQSFIDAAAMLKGGKDQGEIGRMLQERYGLTRGQMPAWGSTQGFEELRSDRPKFLQCLHKIVPARAGWT